MNFRHLLVMAVLATFSIKGMEMMIFDVGQGSCAVVKDPKRGTLVVDAGSTKLNQKVSSDSKINAIADYAALGKHKVTFVVSHGEQDHYGWIPKIASRLLAQKIEIALVLGGTDHDYKTAAINMTPLKKLVALKEKSDGKYASECTFEALAQLFPPYCTLIAAPTAGGIREINSRSIVLKVEGVLLPADSTGEIITRAHNTGRSICSHVFVAAHHGADSEGSNSKELLQTVAPHTIIVSASTKNSHPRENFIRRAVKTLHTKKRVIWHTITFFPDGNVTEKINPSLKIFMSFANNYCTALTDCALYSTLDMGDMAINLENQDYVVRFPGAPLQDENFKTIMLKSIVVPVLENVTKINLSECGIDDADLASLDQLPTTLQELVLDCNPLITWEGLCYIIVYCQDLETDISIAVRKNRINLKTLQYCLREVPLIRNMTRLKYRFFFEKNESLPAKKTYETLVTSYLAQMEISKAEPTHEPYIPHASYEGSNNSYKLCEKELRAAFAKSENEIDN